MKPHLPLNLLSILIACFAAPSMLHGAPLTITANQTFNTDTIWNEDTTIGADNLTLTIDAGKTVTQAGGAFNIGNNNLTITGGGILKIDTAATQKVGSDTFSKKLTINNATLDVSGMGSSLSVPGDQFTRYGITVTNRGVLRVGSFSYSGAGLGGMASNTDYWVLDNGRLEITKQIEADGTNGLTVASGGGVVSVDSTDSTVKINGGAIWQLNGALTITGVGNVKTGANNVLAGSGRLIKDGAGTLTLAHSSSFTGGVELKAGTLVVSDAAGLGTNRVLSVTGNSSIGGISAAFQRMTLSDGVNLNVAAVDNNAGLTLSGATLNLKGSVTLTGNVIAAANSANILNVAGMSGLADGMTLLTVNGTLTMNTGSAFAVVGVQTGANEFAYGSLAAGGNQVIYKFKTGLKTLSWAGASADWAAAGAWQGGATFTEGDIAVFDGTGAADQTVTLSTAILAKRVSVSGAANYTFSGAGSLQGQTVLEKSGTGTWTIANTNALAESSTTISGGTLALTAASALGNGGTITVNKGGVLDLLPTAAANGLGVLNGQNVVINGGTMRIDSKWSAGISGRAGTITLGGNGLLHLSTGWDVYNNLVLANGGGTLRREINDNVAYGGSITGTGNLTKTGSVDLTLSNIRNLGFSGNFTVGEGKVWLAATGAATPNAHSSLGLENTTVWLGTGNVTLNAGTSLNVHFNTLKNNSTVVLGNKLVMNDNSILGVQDGGFSIAGGLHVNGLAQVKWLGGYTGSDINLTGALSGGADAVLDIAGSTENVSRNSRLLVNTAGDFQGKLVLHGGSGNAGANTLLMLQNATALAKATVDLQGVDGKGAAKMDLTMDATIGGLTGNANSAVNSSNTTVRTLTVNNAVNNVYGGLLNDKLNLTKTGAGTLTLNGASTAYVGRTEVRAGTLALGHANALGNSTSLTLYTGATLQTMNNAAYEVAASKTLSIAGTAGTQAHLTGGLTMSGGTLSFDPLSLNSTTAALAANGAVNLTSGTISISSLLGAGDYLLVSGTSAPTGMAGMTLSLNAGLNNFFNSQLSASGNNLKLTLSLKDNVLAWNDAGGSWGTTGATNSWKDGATFTNGAAVVFGDDHAADHTINLVTDVAPSSILFSNNDFVYRLTSASNNKITGTSALLKTGKGLVLIAMTNDYSGGTTIDQGTLAIGATGALGSGAVVVGANGNLEFQTAGAVNALVGAQAVTVNGGSVTFNSAAANTLDKALAGSKINLNVMTAGTALTISTAQANVALTKVGQGAALTLNGGGSGTLLSGNLIVNGGTLNTVGDSFGYNNDGLFGTLTLNNGVWNVGGANMTLSNASIVLNHSEIRLNCAVGNLGGFDLFRGTCTLATRADASGMSVMRLADGATGNAATASNTLTLRGGTAIFDIARSTVFALDATNTADLKLDVSVAAEAPGTDLIKTGNGVLQLTKVSNYSSKTQIRQGTLLLTDTASLGTGEVILGSTGDASLVFALAGANTTNSVISGTGTLTQKGSGVVTLGGANSYVGDTLLQAGTLKAGHASAFGRGIVQMSAGSTLNVDTFAITNKVKLAAGTDALRSLGALTSNGGGIGSLEMGAYSDMTVTGGLVLGSSFTLTADLLGMADGGTLIQMNGQLSGSGTVGVSLANVDKLTAGSYNLWTATGIASTLTFNWLNKLANTTDYLYSFGQKGNSLVLTIDAAGDVLTWSGAGTQWTVDPGAQWSDTTLNPQGAVIRFDNTGLAQGTVELVGTLTPRRVSVENTSGTYTFSGSGIIADRGIGELTSLTKKNEGALTIETSNSYTGGTEVQGGFLNAGALNALGHGVVTLSGGTLSVTLAGNVLNADNKLYFNSGTFRYGAGANQDISSLISADSTGAVKVDTNGQAIAWAASTNYKNLAFEKSGAGVLTIGQGNVFSKAFSVKGGGLTINSGNDQTRFSSGVSVDANAELVVNSTKTGTSSGDAANVVLNGMAGAGKITLDSGTLDSSRFYVSGDNTGFTGELVLNGKDTSISDVKDVQFATAKSMGSGTVTLNGRGFWLTNANAANDAILATLNIGAKGAFLNGSSGKTYYHSGKLTGNGELTTGLGVSGGVNASFVMTGSLVDFTGSFAGINAFRWQFGNNSAAVLKDGAVFGNGVVLKGHATNAISYKFAYTDAQVLMNATVGAAGALNASVEQAGAGTLVLTQDNTATGNLVISSGTVQLGNGGATGRWAGKVTGAGALNINLAAGSVAELLGTNDYLGGTTLASGTAKALGATSFGGGAVKVNGGLLDLNGQAVANQVTITKGGMANAGAYATAKGVSVNAGANSGNISLGGLSGDKLGSIQTTTAGTVVSGIRGDVSLTGNTSLAFGQGNSSLAAGGTGEYLVQFDAGSPSSNLSLGALTITMSSDLLAAMKASKDTVSSVELWLTNGLLSVGGTPEEQLAWLKTVTFDPRLSTFGFAVQGVEGGKITVTGQLDDLYIVSVDGATVDSYNALNPYKGVLVDRNLTINLPGAPGTGDSLVMNSLSGDRGTTVTVNNTNAGGGNPSLVLNNNAGADSTYLGNVAGNTADFTKTGAGSLTIGGTFATTGSLTVQQGTLNLNGGASLATTNVAGGTLGLGNGVNTLGNVTISSGTLDINGNATVTTLTGTGGTIDIASAAELTVSKAGATGTTTLTDTALTGSGTLTIAEGGLSLAGTSSLNGVVLNVKDTASGMDLGASTSTVAGLEGGGRVNANGGALTVSAPKPGDSYEFTGALAGTGSITMSGKGTQMIAGAGNAGYALNVTDGTLALKGGADGAAHYQSLRLTGGTLSLAPVGTAETAVNTQVTLDGNSVIGDGSILSMTVNTDASGFANTPSLVAKGNLTIESGSSIHVSSLNPGAKPTGMGNLEMSLISIEGMLTAPGDLAGVGLTTNGMFNVYYTGQRLEVIQDSNGNDRIVLKADVQMNNILVNGAGSVNSMAGANLLWESRYNLGDKDSLLNRLLTIASDEVTAGKYADASRTMAAAAGSSIPGLVMAQREGLRRQMTSIRNRTTLMGANPAYVNADMPYFNAWIEGNGGYSKLDSSGDEGGYTLSSWGGTAGFDVDLSDNWTLGAAFTADYGDFKASAADSINGDLDSYYVNLFTRFQHKNWAHNVILTGGWNDATLTRNVNLANLSYQASGNTTGAGFGAMYELTYDIALNENKSSILQPLFNASVQHVKMDGYRESGAGNAGLSVEGMDMTTGTLALGGRWMGLVGSNVFGREALAEFRVNVAQDMGDRRGQARVGFVGNPAFTQPIRSNDMGSTALQFGAGLNIPVGVKSAIYMNADADIRSGASGVSGTLGYRYNF